MTMKKIFGLLLAALLLAACGSSQMSAEQKAARNAEQIRTVRKAVEARRFVVEANYMLPRRGPARHIDYGYSIELRGDTLISCLPYFGRAYNVPYGGGKGLNFTAPVSDYNCRWTKDRSWRIEMNVDNGEDQLLYMVEVFETGQASISVMARERETISFNGKFAEPKKL